MFTQNRRTKSIGRQVVDLAFAATLILGSAITPFDSAMASPSQQLDIPNDGTTINVYMPITLSGFTASTNTAPFLEMDEEEHHEFDGHDHVEEVDGDAQLESAYTALNNYITEEEDGTVRIADGAIDTAVAETGIAASVFAEIVASIDETNEAIATIEEDELSALGNDLGCITSFPTLRYGSRGWWVWRLQTWLNANHGKQLSADSIYGGQTYNAVRSVQQHWRNQGKTACGYAIGVDGVVGRQGWTIARNTKSGGIAAPPPSNPGPSTNTYRQPQLGSATGLCAYGYGHKRFGKDSALDRLENVGKTYKNRGEGYISVGNISLDGGGYMAPHKSHQVGLDIDLRPMRTNNGQCSSGMQWNWNGYDRDATRQLIKDLRATGRIKTIYFNDPTLRNEGLTTYAGGHDNHLHVRFCEPGHSNYRYRC